MIFRIPRYVFWLVGLGILVVIGLLGQAVWQAWQATPTYQFQQARRLWADRPFSHYRMTANYFINWAQCYYDIEVRDQRIVQTFTLACLSSSTSGTPTVDGIFENFEPFITDRVCSPNGCYCEGAYVIRASYDATWGYPQRITTEFHRNWLDDLLHGKQGVRLCLRTDPVVKKIEIVTLTPLP